jgi:hypothetical protein
MATPKGPRRASPDEEDAKYPNLAAAKAWDKEQHVKKGVAAGLTRKQAVRHANDEVHED